MKIAVAMRIAINEAKKSNEKHKIGCIIYEGSKYCTSYNRTFTGCKVVGKQTPWSDHAEAICINHSIYAGIDLEKSTMVVIRLKNGDLMESHPCKWCEKLIIKHKIPKIYYSSDPLHRELIPSNFKSLSKL